MEKSIFYSWQSDLPNNENRGFIESCIENAIKELNNSHIAFDTVLDRDTKDKTGASDITDSIFEKIDSCNIFIAEGFKSLIRSPLVRGTTVSPFPLATEVSL